MKRKQVYVEEEQERLLKRRSKEIGVSESELIRRGIELACRDTSSLPLDHAAWEEELRFMDKLSKIKVPQAANRGWTRDELYERVR